MEDPIVVNSAGKQYVGCTGCPADSHNVLWVTVRTMATNEEICRN